MGLECVKLNVNVHPGDRDPWVGCGVFTDNHVKRLKTEAPPGAGELSTGEAEGQKYKKLNSARSVRLLSLLFRTDSPFKISCDVTRERHKHAFPVKIASIF